MKNDPCKIPLRSISLLVWSFFVFLLSVAYTAKINPELQFLNYAWEIKDRAENISSKPDNLSKSGGRIIFCGGSSVLVGINPDEISNIINKPVLNLGMAAGMGPKVLSVLALERMKEGDLLIISLEPDLLTLPQRSLMLASQMSWISGHPSWMNPQALDQWVVSLSHLRPGAYHAFTLLGKLIAGKPLYRYEKNELTQSGWQKINYDTSNLGWPVFSYNLTDGAKKILTRINDVCHQKGARCIYVPSLHYCPEDRLEDHEAGMINFLKEVTEIIPVFSLSKINCSVDESLFADTPWHPLPQEATKNSRRMASMLNESGLLD